jgi:hypothetical protein
MSTTFLGDTSRMFTRMCLFVFCEGNRRERMLELSLGTDHVGVGAKGEPAGWDLFSGNWGAVYEELTDSASLGRHRLQKVNIKQG